MKQTHGSRLLTTVLAALSCGGAFCQVASAPAASHGEIGTPTGVKPKTPAPSEKALSVFVAPSTFGTDQDFAGGCWVRFYDGVQFVGQQLTVVGPLSVSDMARVSPSWRRWNSAVVGPNARITIFSGKNFEQRSATMKPGERASDLAAKDVGWYGKIESVQVGCPSK